MKQNVFFVLCALCISINVSSQIKLVATGGYITNPPNSYLVVGSSAADAVTLPNPAGYIINTGYVEMAGGVSNTGGNFTSTAGTIILNGTSAQTTNGGDYTISTINGLVINNPTTVTLTGAMYITDSVSVQQGTFDENTVSFTLRSTAPITARVAPVYGSIVNSSQTTAERFIPAHRAWRLLGPAVNSTETFNTDWQEGVYNTSYSPWPAANNDPVPGFGTHISGTQSPPGLGFDATPHNNPSVQTYNGGSPIAGTDSWTGIPNTLSTPLNTAVGYMTFVRGSRAVGLPLNTAAPADNTVLRSRGSLRTYAQTFNCPANSFTLIGNPYASTIDFAGLTRNALNNSFSVWDPNLTGTYGVGAYVTYTWTGASYAAAPVPASVGLGQFIQSGQAFIVQNNTAAPTTLVINEANKTTGSVSTIFTPLQAIESLRTNIYSTSDTPVLEDGTLALFNDAYSRGLDAVDAMKPNNFRETISHRSFGKSLAIEARPIIISSDTLFYNISLYQQPYRFEFIASGLDHPGLTGYLHDNYLQSNTPISLNDTTRVDFVTNSDVTSRDSSRFYIVFTTGNPLPVTVSSIKAYQHNAGINVDWTLSQEINMDKYEVEKSITGSNLSQVGTVASTGNHSNSVTYSWFDANPNIGPNYYRVNMIDRNNHSSYTQIVKVVLDKGAPSITVYPNPVSGNTIAIQLNNIDKGTYNITLSNKLGQIIYTSKIIHQGGSATQTIELDRKLASATYQLKIGDYTTQVIKE